MLDCCAWSEVPARLPQSCTCTRSLAPVCAHPGEPFALGQQRTCRNVMQLLPREPLVTSGAAAVMVPVGLRDKDRGAERAELSRL